MTGLRRGEPPSAPGERVAPWRTVLRRALPVVISGITIYILMPVLTRVFTAWPRLSSLLPMFAAIGVVAEAASLTCTFMLKRIALRTRAVFVVVTSGLVGNAVTNVLPGADATGATVEFSMLSSAGVDTGAAIGGLTATALLQTASVLLLPVLAVPAILGGLPVPRGLKYLVFLGLAMFALCALGSFVIFWADWPLRTVGRLAERLHNRLRRLRPISGLPERLIAQRNSTRAALGARWWQALLYVLGKVAFDFACLLAMLAATRARPEPWLILIAYSATVVLAWLPLTPGGLGLVEGSLTGLLVLSGVPGANAVLSTLAYRVASYWLPTFAGPPAYLAYRLRFSRGSQSTTPPGEEPER